MDSNRFDALVQSLATSGSRRRLLGGILAGGLTPLGVSGKSRHNRRDRPAASTSPDHGRSAAGATSAQGPAPAACLAVGKRCSQPATESTVQGKGKRGGKGKHHPPSCDKCCSRFGAPGANGKPRCACKPEGEACANPSQCCGGLCKNGQCTKCPDGLTACSGQCVDLQTNDQYCGSCTTSCASGQRCVGGTCVCDDTSCPRGCCDKNGVCQRGTSDQACGVDGAECQTCGTCTTCDGTQCVNAAGCCGDASVCQSGQCQACAQGQRCEGGSCVCDATSCANGCCDGDTCVSFAQQSTDACGAGGAACQACAGYDTCGGGGTNGVCGCTPATTCPGGQTCGTAQDGCGGAIACRGCAGCCDGNACNGGTDNAACGKSGDPCISCTLPDTCGGGNPGTAGVCGCTPDADSKTCAGKCGTIQNNCGQNVNCTSLCAGCCDGAICRGGADNNACGVNGAACATCSGFDTCGGGGTKGKCGCTAKCANMCNGQLDSCGGMCGCPKCKKCYDAGSIQYCIADYEQICDDGQRCCFGRCPATGCTKPNQCCSNSNVFTCQGICCAPSVATVRSSTCPSTQMCSTAYTGKVCDGDSDCTAGSELCVCAQCCKVSGQACSQAADCCSFTCQLDGTCF